MYKNMPPLRFSNKNETLFFFAPHFFFGPFSSSVVGRRSVRRSACVGIDSLVPYMARGAGRTTKVASNISWREWC